MAPWGARQGLSGVVEGVEAAALLRTPRPAPLADDPSDEAPPPRRPIALSPSLPNLVFGADADAHVPPAPWGDAAGGAAAGTCARLRNARAAPVSVAARVLALVDAHGTPPVALRAVARAAPRGGGKSRAPVGAGPRVEPRRGALRGGGRRRARHRRCPTGGPDSKNRPPGRPPPLPDLGPARGVPPVSPHAARDGG